MEKNLISKQISRVAAFGAAGVLGAVALVGIAPAADAAKLTGKTNYTCVVPGLFDFTVPTTVKIDLPKKAKKNKKVKGKTVVMNMTIDEGTSGLIRELATGVGGTASGVTFKVGKTKVAVKNVKIPVTDTGDSGTIKLTAKGKAASFKAAKKKGTYAVKVPKAFEFTPTNQDGVPLVGTIGCSGKAVKAGTLKVK